MKALSVILLLGAITLIPQYESAIEARRGNAVIILVQDGCTPCRRMETDIVPALREAGMLEDTSITIVSLNREPELARKLYSTKMNRMRGTPMILCFRIVGTRQQGWRAFGYNGHASLVEWLKGIKQWRPEKKT